MAQTDRDDREVREQRALWKTRTGHLPKNYVTHPVVEAPEGISFLDHEALLRKIELLAKERSTAVLAIDTYPGADVEDIIRAISAHDPNADIVRLEDVAALPSHDLEALLAPFLTDDRVFGRMNDLEITDLYEGDEVVRLRRDLEHRRDRTVVIGWGATLVAPQPAVKVLVDVARWEIQHRQRAGQPNWMAHNPEEESLRKYKRSFFIEWRVADRHKLDRFDEFDFVIDGNRSIDSTFAVSGADARSLLRETARRPFRVKPFFDPGVWGGYWMEHVVGLEPQDKPYAWCFDCVPEENSLLFSDAAGKTLELPAIDVVLMESENLLGEAIVRRFGREFPIRFDLLDTMGGQNLSLQVHPMLEYIREHFGMNYTQDESYYLLDAAPGAVTYLGLRDDIDPPAMLSALERSQATGESFDADDYVNVWPTKAHDHFLIPAGTVHCSGGGTVVLEVSATPNLFTFKLWDWGRMGLDGRPRPIHLEHGRENIQWDRTTEWTRDHLVNDIRTVADAEEHTEEITGLHEQEFIQTRRHWFSEPITLRTGGTVRVHNLVSGAAAVISSPAGAFEPYEVHFAETFIVPAAVDEYTVSPIGAPTGTPRHGLLVASVRGASNIPEDTEQDDRAAIAKGDRA
ncbi:class I mannose-6-phosphate isomerase [uncultured Agrococcus sp.]|uniref:class I mannose-6-phosphate isomerase n=1 Tax=uncultured Agrococcus sp. TaxID=382258 RepID=UPI0025F4944D|nr:class I mannose-6-phosphate isomerase [uncultured Agrococcus sp.]